MRVLIGGRWLGRLWGGVKALRLGVLYVNGQGVPQNYEMAGQWHRRAADQRVAAAQFQPGVLYANGQGVPQSYAEAARWHLI